MRVKSSRRRGFVSALYISIRWCDWWSLLLSVGKWVVFARNLLSSTCSIPRACEPWVLFTALSNSTISGMTMMVWVTAVGPYEVPQSHGPSDLIELLVELCIGVLCQIAGPSVYRASMRTSFAVHLEKSFNSLCPWFGLEWRASRQVRSTTNNKIIPPATFRYVCLSAIYLLLLASIYV